MKRGEIRLMKRKLTARSKKRRARRDTVTLPLAEWLQDALMQMPAECFRSRSQAERSCLMLAAHEGVLAMAEHFHQVRAARPLRRSDLVFRLEVKPGCVGRAAEAELQARAIEQVLRAATRAARV